MGRRIVIRGAGALVLAAALVGLVPAAPPAGAAARTVGRSVTATPAGKLTSTTLAVADGSTGRRAADRIEEIGRAACRERV